MSEFHTDQRFDASSRDCIEFHCVVSFAMLQTSTGIYNPINTLLQSIFTPPQISSEIFYADNLYSCFFCSALVVSKSLLFIHCYCCQRLALCVVKLHLQRRTNHKHAIITVKLFNLKKRRDCGQKTTNS